MLLSHRHHDSGFGRRASVCGALAVGKAKGELRPHGGAEQVEYTRKVLPSKSERPDAKRWAIEYLTERTLGRAPQSIELTGKDGAPVEYSESDSVKRLKERSGR